MQTVSKIFKTLVYGGAVSCAVLDTTALVNEAIARHSLTPVCAAALGRAMTATAYLCSWLKCATSSLSVLFDGDGAGGKLCVAGNGALELRGYLADPHVQLPPRADGKLDVGGCVGSHGTLTVSRDDGEGLPFTGTCSLVSGEIAEDFSAYFLESEQRPTGVALGVKVGTDGRCIAAGGLFLQPLPGADEELLRRVEARMSEFSSLSSLLEREGAAGILARFDHGEIDGREIVYRCSCSREKVGALLLSLGRAEAESILAQEGRISVHCDFCNTDHTFTEEDVRALFGKESA